VRSWRLVWTLLPLIGTTAHFIFDVFLGPLSELIFEFVGGTVTVIAVTPADNPLVSNDWEPAVVLTAAFT